MTTSTEWIVNHDPEFASGALVLRDCAIDQLHLKNTKGAWGAQLAFDRRRY